MESEDISALNPQDFDFDPNHTEDENSLDTPDLNEPAFSLNESDTSTSLTEDDLQESGEGPNLSPYAINTDPVVSNHGVYSTSKVVEVLQESLQAEQLVLQQEWRHFPNPNDLDKQEETQSV